MERRGRPPEFYPDGAGSLPPPSSVAAVENDTVTQKRKITGGRRRGLPPCRSRVVSPGRTGRPVDVHRGGVWDSKRRHNGQHIARLHLRGGSVGFDAGHAITPGKRGKISGWSLASLRGLERRLRSIDFPAWTQAADLFAFTFTVRKRRGADVMPASAYRPRLERFKRLVREIPGFHSAQGLTEFQESGSPHVHGSVGFAKLPDGSPVNWRAPRDLCRAWLAAFADYAPDLRCQSVKEIEDADGWAEYLERHSVRGMMHYQRRTPDAWAGETIGEMSWVICGSRIPRAPSLVAQVSAQVAYRMRRVMRRLALSRARCYRVRAGRSISRIRRMLKRVKSPALFADDVRRVSTVRGVSFALRRDVALRLFLFLGVAPAQWE